MVGGVDLTIDEEGGRTLAEPLIAIADYYGLSATGPWVLWVNLVAAMTAVYGSKIFGAYVAQRLGEAPTPPVWPVSESSL